MIISLRGGGVDRELLSGWLLSRDFNTFKENLYVIQNHSMDTILFFFYYIGRYKWRPTKFMLRTRSSFFVLSAFTYRKTERQAGQKCRIYCFRKRHQIYGYWFRRFVYNLNPATKNIYLYWKIEKPSIQSKPLLHQHWLKLSFNLNLIDT